MNKKYFDLTQVLVLIGIIFFTGFTFGVSFNYFTDGEISCYPLEKIKEIQQNNFQFNVRCYIK